MAIFRRRVLGSELVRISYQKLDFHGISRFSDVSIINNLNALIQKVNIGFLLTDYTKK
jgi:hypothetical protein